MENILFSGCILTDAQRDLLSKFITPFLNFLIEKVSQRVKDMIDTRPPKYIGRKETAELLCVTLPTLNEYTKKGIVTGHKINGRMLYDLYEIENAVKSNLKYRRKTI